MGRIRTGAAAPGAVTEYSANPFNGWTCYVEQGFYGHLSRKPTWLFAAGVPTLPELHWGKGAQRLHPVALEKHGTRRRDASARLAMVGGKRKKEIRNATPPAFRDVLISIARSAGRQERRAA